MRGKISCILFLAGLLRMGDFFSDILYISTEPFFSDLLYYLSIVFLLLPSLPTLIFVTGVEMVSNESKTENGKFNVLFALLMSCGEQFGIYSIFLGIYLHYRPEKHDTSSLVYMTRYTAVLHSIFESMPSPVIQLLNCGKTLRFSKILIISCVFSGLSIFLTILRVVYLFDIVRKEEKAQELPDVYKYTGRKLSKKTEYTIDISQETK